jgi:hypothetical protein
MFPWPKPHAPSKTRSPVSMAYQAAVIALAGGSRSVASSTKWLKKNKAHEFAALKRAWAPQFTGICRAEMLASAYRLDGQGRYF